jgi:N-acetylmuramoyl-L-alanine amidase
MAFVDGPLQLVVRYPSDSASAPRDSMTVWGSVGSGRAALRINGRPVKIEPNGAFIAWVAVPDGPVPVLEFIATLDGRAASRRIRLWRPSAPGPGSPPSLPLRPATGWVRLRRLPSDTADSATQWRPVFSRWFPGGPVALPIPLGSRLPMDARTPDAVRLRLSEGVRAWVSAAEADTLGRRPTGPVPLGDMTVAERDDVVEVSVVAAEPLPSTVELQGPRVRWSVYGARQASDVIEAPPGSAHAASRRAGPAGRVDFELVPPWPPAGWRARWESGRLVLQLRAPWPRSRGLAGLVVALDAGHPPGGTIGPTGLREDSVTLAVARAAADQLARLGARPILVRRDSAPVSLEARIAAAEAADARVFVSIHLDAPAEGRPPQQADGTWTLYYEPFAARLAELLESSVATAMHQPSRGVRQGNLAVLRATWFPAALIEGTCLVLPEREAWFRTPAAVAAYSAGIVAGVARWAGDSESRSPSTALVP